MDEITHAIADYASYLRYEAIDSDSRHAAIQRLIDSLGCALGAHDCEEAKIGRRVAAGQGAGHYAGRILLHGDLLPLESAAFVNTAMIRNLDFNDRYPGGHPSDCLGALLAFAGARPVSGARFIAAMVVTYEIFARLSDAAKLSRRGWDQGYAVAVATAAGLANLLGLDLAHAAHAIGIAATSNLPLRVTRSGELTPWKNAATAYAVRNGAFATLLAAEGMVGPGHAFDGRNGLFDNVTGPFALAAFPNDGGLPLTPRVQLKYWPIETNGQPLVWAALDLRQRIAADQVAEIECFTSKFTWFEIGSEPEKWDPKTRETADHSLPYIFARSFLDGPLTQHSFSEAAVRDPDLRPLMAKIKVTVDEEIERVLAETVILRVRVTARDGTRYDAEVINPLGHPDNPMRDEHINQKFLGLAEPVLGERRSREALDAWWHVAGWEELLPLLKSVAVAPTG
jgi:2-methylcitrate dehydratase